MDHSAGSLVTTGLSLVPTLLVPRENPLVASEQG